jgi:hypothetical protein
LCYIKTCFVDAQQIVEIGLHIYANSLAGCYKQKCTLKVKATTTMEPSQRAKNRRYVDALSRAENGKPCRYKSERASIKFVDAMYVCRTSKMKKDSAFNTSWDRKMRERQTLKAVKGIQNGLRDDKRQKLEEKKKRRIEQEQRRQENLKRAEVVQEIKSSHKLKRAKKKLLRKIEKRDTTVVDKS